MIVLPTQRLYFNKFVYSIQFKLLLDRAAYINTNPLIQQIKKELKSVPNRTRIDWNITQEKLDVTLNVYLNDDSMYNSLLNKYSNSISQTYRPISEKHKGMLVDKIEIIIRDKLLYNKFSYKVIFKTGFGRQNYTEITDYINSAFEDRPKDFLIKGRWMISLYLTNKEDLMQIRLSLSEHITQLIKIETFAEHNS